MSVIDLVVLGILMDEPMNAYRLAGFIEERELGRMVKISKPVVYKSCKRLKAAGHLDSKTVRETELPEKVVYSVNRSGRRHFSDLMRHFSSRVNPFHFEFNSFIWNLERVDHAEGLQMLQGLNGELAEILGWLRIHEKEEVAQANFSARVIVKQYRMVFTTLVQWAGETLSDYKKMGAKKK